MVAQAPANTGLRVQTTDTVVVDTVDVGIVPVWTAKKRPYHASAP